MTSKYLSNYLNNDINDDRKEVSNIQSPNFGALPFFTALLGVMLVFPLSSLTKNLYIIAISCCLSIIYFIYTFVISINKYTHHNFFITNIVIKNNTLYLMKGADSRAPHGDFKYYLKQYDINNIKSLSINVKLLSNDDKYKKLHFFDFGKCLEVQMNIMANNKLEVFNMYFTTDEESYRKIIEIISLLKNIHVFDYNLLDVNDLYDWDKYLKIYSQSY